jgi:hypothetical protein
MTWACAVCGTPKPDPLGDAWCGTCNDDTLSVHQRLSEQQRIRICVLFRDMGEVHRATRMRRLTHITGRLITTYNDLTPGEAEQVEAALKEESRAK